MNSPKKYIFHKILAFPQIIHSLYDKILTFSLTFSILARILSAMFTWKVIFVYIHLYFRQIHRLPRHQDHIYLFTSIYISGESIAYLNPQYLVIRTVGFLLTPGRFLILFLLLAVKTGIFIKLNQIYLSCHPAPTPC